MYSTAHNARGRSPVTACIQVFALNFNSAPCIGYAGARLWRVCRCRSDARRRVTSSRRLSNVAVQWYSVNKGLKISCSGLTGRESVHHALSMTHCHICTLRPLKWMKWICKGHSVTSTRHVATCLNMHGGIRHWMCGTREVPPKQHLLARCIGVHPNFSLPLEQCRYSRTRAHELESVAYTIVRNSASIPA
jgi:hypothetical protein